MLVISRTLHHFIRRLQLVETILDVRNFSCAQNSQTPKLVLNSSYSTADSRYSPPTAATFDKAKRGHSVSDSLSYINSVKSLVYESKRIHVDHLVAQVNIQNCTGHLYQSSENQSVYNCLTHSDHSNLQDPCKLLCSDD